MFTRALSSILLLIVILPAAAQDRNAASQFPSQYQVVVPAPADAPAKPASGSFSEVIDRVVKQERLLLTEMRSFRPLVETYLQNLKSDAAGNVYPANDQYFLGRLDMSEGPQDVSFLGPEGGRWRLGKLAEIFSLHYQAAGFTQMIVPDTDFDKRNYEFTFVRREFLGEVRCLVIDVHPKAEAPPGRFQGRLWVEDNDYNIVRFNGTFSRPARDSFYLHFDSWRLNLKPGFWLPAYVYSEESDKENSAGRLRLKAQTRLWGYDLEGGKKRTDEFTQILVDSHQPVIDRSEETADATPVAAERLWERQAENNVIERLEKVGLLAPTGPVDNVLQTVVNNLLLTNNIDLQSPVHCRVLLTAPLESFTIGHTIVLSRGLLDVLPDEASLAMVLAHEVSHIVLGHPFDARLAFNDRMFFPDEQSFQRLDFKRRASDEEAADAKALDLLKNSPYKEKLGTAGLFLKALQERAPELPSLIRPHLGNSLAAGQSIRMSVLLATAPALDDHRIDQIAALPLGGRVKLDPWSDQIELAKTHPITLALSREKMPFEITPFFPHINRLAPDGADKTAVAASGSK